MQHAIRFCLLFVGGLLVLGCDREGAEEAPEEQAADTAAADAGVSVEDIAGTWDMRSVPESGEDTTATVYQIQVTGDEWTLLLPEREPMQGAVTTSGDSIIVEAGPFESVRRDGVMVRTRASFRLEGERLVGTTVARYETSGADSVLRLRTEGIRAQ